MLYGIVITVFLFLLIVGIIAATCGFIFGNEIAAMMGLSMAGVSIFWGICWAGYWYSGRPEEEASSYD